MRGMVASSSRNVPPSWGQNIRQEPAKRQTGTRRPFLSAAAPSSDSEPIDCPGRHAGRVFAGPAAQERPVHQASCSALRSHHPRDARDSDRPRRRGRRTSRRRLVARGSAPHSPEARVDEGLCRELRGRGRGGGRQPATRRTRSSGHQGLQDSGHPHGSRAHGSRARCVTGHRRSRAKLAADPRGRVRRVVRAAARARASELRARSLERARRISRRRGALRRGLETIRGIVRGPQEPLPARVFVRSPLTRVSHPARERPPRNRYHPATGHSRFDRWRILMGKAIEELAHFAAATPWETIPSGVRAHAKLVLLDTLGVILAGSVQAEVAGVRARLTATGGRGATVYAPGWPATDPRTAALLNGLAGRSIELCEGHRYVSCQGAVQVLPTALASAEWLERSGRETLAALIFGYEVAARLGSGLTARPIAHQNGQAPLLGAVAAGARLRSMTGAQMSLALRIGATLVLTPGYTNAVAGATALNVAGGMSGFAGALAPELALAGVAAQPNAIEEAFGQLVGDGFRAEAVTEELGHRWEIARNYFRLRACCNPIYAALDALEEILAEVRPDPASIERIEVATYRFAANMREPNPINYFAAKYSLPHAAAALVLRGNAGYHAFTDDVVRDPAIGAFRRRVTVREDPELSAQVPRLKPARVTVTFTDGRQVTRLRESARGDYQDPYGEGEIRSKFRELAGVVLDAAGVARVEGLVDRLDELPRLGDLVEALRA